MNRETLLMAANSECDANMLYASKIFVPDEFLYLRVQNRPHLLVSDLEYQRARKEAGHCRVHRLNAYQAKLQRNGRKRPTLARVIEQFLRERRLKRIVVPENFPLGLARELRALRIKLKVKPGHFFPERELKSSEEVKKISAALIMAEVGLAEGIQALKSCKISKDGRLLRHNVPFTAEKLRAIIEVAVLQAGGRAAHTIVAGGKQSSDPHEQGYGPLRANQPIVLDVFPRSQRTGYYGDITRTVVKGRAKESVRKLFHTVKKVQEFVIDKVAHGAPGLDLHHSVEKLFDEAGYKTTRRNGHLEGFFHGTGHGLGLELHEAPRIGALTEDVIKAGHIVTVEPGLYYSGLGGVRLEDVLLITKGKARNLTKFEKVLEV